MNTDIDTVNAWLAALVPHAAPRLNEAGRLALRLDQQTLFLKLSTPDHDPEPTAMESPSNAVLSWSLPVPLAEVDKPLTPAQRRRALGLNFMERETRGARLALCGQPERLHLVYQQPLHRCDATRFRHITGELVATARQVARVFDQSNEPGLTEPAPTTLSLFATGRVLI